MLTEEDRERWRAVLRRTPADVDALIEALAPLVPCPNPAPLRWSRVETDDVTAVQDAYGALWVSSGPRQVMFFRAETDGLQVVERTMIHRLEPRWVRIDHEWHQVDRTVIEQAAGIPFVHVRAELVAGDAHAGQTYPVGVPYVEYLSRVAGRLSGRVTGDFETEALAWLHAVVARTPLTVAFLHSLFPADVVAAVDALTPRPGEPATRYAARVGQNAMARRVREAARAVDADMPARADAPPSH